MTTTPPSLPLAGYRVIELAHLIAGPVCGMYLADMGAEVIKLEHPRGGDVLRSVYGHLDGGDAVFRTVNRNKRSLAVDLSRPEVTPLLRRLVERADVVIEAYRGGVAERLGVDYARLTAVNPRLVYCSLSAFGPDGPWREKPGLDMLVQALGGMMAITGEPDGGPVLCGTPVVDTIGALLAGQGILTALLHRERTGIGQRIDVSLLAGALLAHAARLPLFLAGLGEPGRYGSAHPYVVPFQAFRASDGWIYVAVWVERLWPPFCAALGREGLASDPRYASQADRLRHRKELTALLESLFLERTVEDWMQALEEHDVLCAPVNRYADLPDDPRVLASGMIVEQADSRGGRFRTLNTPVQLEKTPGGIREPAPALGQHTDSILRESGMSVEEVGRLRDLRVVA
jgi:crotonobetainyl-CoA:carnitine CoA-transferase CaiB-like acyl-CoA transferase